MDLSIWTRVSLLLLGAAAVVAIMLLVVARFPQESLAVFGTWLLLYRLLIRSRWRAVVQIFTSAVSGTALALLAPLLPALSHCFVVLALVGGLLAALSFRMSAAVASTCIGTALGALLWQMGLCTMVPMSHGWVLACSAGIFFAIFSCTPLGPPTLERILMPVLGALLLVVGIGPRLGMLAQGPLLQVSQSEDLSQAARATSVAWLALATCGMAFQWFMLRGSDSDNSAKDGKKETLAESLLVEEKGKSDEGAGVIEDKNAGMERMPVLCTAIFADEGTSQAHLSEHERALVEVCRKDEFERDRILWGGGLL